MSLVIHCPGWGVQVLIKYIKGEKSCFFFFLLSPKWAIGGGGQSLGEMSPKNEIFLLMPHWQMWFTLSINISSLKVTLFKLFLTQTNFYFLPENIRGRSELWEPPPACNPACLTDKCVAAGWQADRDNVRLKCRYYRTVNIDSASFTILADFVTKLI